MLLSVSLHIIDRNTDEGVFLQCQDLQLCETLLLSLLFWGWQVSTILNFSTFSTKDPSDKPCFPFSEHFLNAQCYAWLVDSKESFSDFHDSAIDFYE